MATQTGKHAGGRPSLGLRAYLGIRIPMALYVALCAAQPLNMSRSVFVAGLLRKALRVKA